MKYILAKGFIAVDGISLTARPLLRGTAQRQALLVNTCKNTRQL